MVADYVKLSRHTLDLDDDGHDTNASGFTPVYVSLELNSPPSGTAVIDFDTFYDKDGNDLSLVLPAALGLSYAAGVLTPDEDGVWLISVGWYIEAAPGVAGELRIEIDGINYGYWPRHFVAASGNSDATNTSMWQVERTFAMQTGAFDQFFCQQIFASGTPLNYMSMDIIRLAASIA